VIFYHPSPLAKAKSKADKTDQQYPSSFIPTRSLPAQAGGCLYCSWLALLVEDVAIDDPLGAVDVPVLLFAAPVPARGHFPALQLQHYNMLHRETASSTRLMRVRSVLFR
jgi:hypothetical protein